MTRPCAGDGHTNLPRSSRLLNRQAPWPSNQINLIRSPRRPRKTNKCPENGSCLSCFSASAERPLKPLRMSVTPAASHTLVCAGTGITDATDPDQLQDALRIELAPQQQPMSRPQNQLDLAEPLFRIRGRRNGFLRRHLHRQERDVRGQRAILSSKPRITPPAEHHVRVQAVIAGNRCHCTSTLERLAHHPTLVSRRIVPRARSSTHQNTVHQILVGTIAPSQATSINSGCRPSRAGRLNAYYAALRPHRGGPNA